MSTQQEHASYYNFYQPIQPNIYERVLIWNSHSNIFITTSTEIANTLQYGEIDHISEIQRQLLIKHGFLVADQDEISTVMRENHSANLTNEVLTETLLPSARCQLDCNYCGQTHSKANWSDDVIKAIMLHILSRLDQYKPKKLQVNWFGSEPLLSLSKLEHLSTQLIEICLQRNVEYAARVVTNGLRLTPDVCTRLQKIAVTEVEVTIDGVGMYHDLHRSTKNGHASFPTIWKNVQTLLESPNNLFALSIRCNVDRDNMQGVAPLIEILREYKSKVRFYTAPVYPWGNLVPKALDKEDFAKFQLNINALLIKSGWQIGVLPKRKTNMCIGTTNLGEVIDPMGNVMACTEGALVKTYEYHDSTQQGCGYHAITPQANTHRHMIGHVLMTEARHHRFRDFMSDTVTQLPCYQCKLFPSCAGVCAKVWSEQRVACPAYKLTIGQNMILHYLQYRSKSDDVINSIPPSPVMERVLGAEVASLN